MTALLCLLLRSCYLGAIPPCKGLIRRWSFVLCWESSVELLQAHGSSPWTFHRFSVQWSGFSSKSRKKRGEKRRWRWESESALLLDKCRSSFTGIKKPKSLRCRPLSISKVKPKGKVEALPVIPNPRLRTSTEKVHDFPGRTRAARLMGQIALVLVGVGELPVVLV